LSHCPERAVSNKAKKSILLALFNTAAFLYFCHRVYKLDGAVWASIAFLPCAPILYSIIKNGADQNGIDAFAFATTMVICIAYYNNYKSKKANQEADEK
jgi:thiamine transporter ThiT